MLTDNYLKLITSQYADKPKFRSWLTALLGKIEQVFQVGIYFDEASDLDYAIGKQLDINGDILGRSRLLPVELTDIYFSWDEENLGWDNGIWKDLYDPDTGIVELPDDLFRIVLKAKVAANCWNGTIPGAYKIYDEVYSSLGGKIIVQDNQDMSITVGIVGIDSSPVFTSLLKLGYIFMKPGGVNVRFYIYPQKAQERLFAWDAESDRLCGWDEGHWGSELRMSY